MIDLFVKTVIGDKVEVEVKCNKECMGIDSDSFRCGINKYVVNCLITNGMKKTGGNGCVKGNITLSRFIG